MFSDIKNFFRSQEQPEATGYHSRDDAQKEPGWEKSFEQKTAENIPRDSECVADTKTPPSLKMKSHLNNDRDWKIDQMHSFSDQDLAPTVTATNRQQGVKSNSNLHLPETHQAIADKLKQNGKIDEAAQHYRKAVELKVNAQTLASKPDTLLGQEQQGKGIQIYDPCIPESSKDQNILDQNVPKSSQKLAFEPQKVGVDFSITNSSVSIDMPEQSPSLSEDSNSLALVRHVSEQPLTFGPIKVYLDQAEMYCREKNWEKAISACQEALQISPETASAYKLWGNILQNMGQMTEAMGYYAKALVIQPDFPEVYANLGSLYAKKEQWDEAIAYYQKAISLNPNFAGAYRNLAKIWAQLKQVKKHLQCRVYALRLDPTFGNAEEHYQLGNTLLEEGQVDEAIHFYRTALELKPDFLLACNKLADALEKQGDWKSAVTYYRQVLDIRAEQVKDASEDSVIQNSQSQKTAPLVSSKEKVKNVINVQRSTQKDTHSKNTPSPESSLEAQTQNKLEASLAKSHSDSVQIALGDSYLQQENWEQAIESYKAALRLNSESVDAYLKLARAFNQVGKKIEMAESFYRACNLDITRATGRQYLMLGQIFLKHDETDKAIICYKHALQVEPNLVDAYRQLGDVFKTQGKKDEAMEVYQKALSLRPQDEVEKKKN